jgi:DNA mismatch endonuclease (patch repair protein)
VLHAELAHPPCPLPDAGDVRDLAAGHVLAHALDEEVEDAPVGGAESLLGQIIETTAVPNAVTPERSRNMSRVRGKDTRPELAVRRLLHREGFRFRLHVRELPGRPDVVLPRHRAVVEVRGCFWHRHPGCPRATAPSTNVEFWERKLTATVERDARNEAALRAAGWRVIVVWECETRDEDALRSRLLAELAA